MSRRGNSGESEESYSGNLATPQYDPSAIEHMHLSLDDDSPYPAGDGGDDDEDDEENEEEEQERYSRGRSRSRSLHSLDEDPNTGVLKIDPSTIAQNNGGSASDHRAAEIVEKSGPLPQKDVETLKKGMEEALHHKNSNVLREEEEEQQDAEDERKSRTCTNSSTSSSSESKRVKILMLGDSGVGKSSLIIRWTQDTFSTDLVGTVGVNFKTRKINVGSESVQVQVWDTAGQEQFHKITTSYYKGANGIMLVYDVSDRKSVENVEYWVKNIKSHASDAVHVALIGNKVDLRLIQPQNCADASFGQNFAGKFGVPYFETSAKESTNVEQAFITLVNTIVESDRQSSPRGSTSAASSASGVSAPSTPRDGKPKKDKKDCVIS